ncbi:MAG: virulence factor SrfC family protein [Pirellulaceae bacterium]
MTADRDGFPEDRDLAIQAQAENLVNCAEELTQWVGQHGPRRLDGEFEINATDEFQLLRLRRLASNLFNSSKVPVAASVYGPSQVGKSLFMGRVLRPVDDRDSPLGKCDTLSPDAYIRELSFDWDINPQSGANEATALVTRFTTKDRFDPDALPEYPVKVRALSRSEWLRVLARGFRSECPPSTATWEEGQLREMFESISQTHGADAGNRNWQMDLIDTYAYMRNLDHRQFKVEEAMFNSFLSRYPLSESGYVEVASRLFWDSSSAPEIRGRITQLFNDVHQYIAKVRQGGRDGILIHWGAAKFLLDSQRVGKQHSKNSRWQQDTKWTDFSDSIRNDWYVLDHAPGGRGPADDVSIIQAAMLEMVIPIVPHRLNGDWREVVKKMDILDLPGMVAGGGESEGRSNVAQSLEEKMMIVKRGKVFYLIERYIEERQIQTLLLLMRGGNVNVRQLLKEYVDKWGRTRYGEEAWPQRVQAAMPALFIGMTGIDEEFETRNEVNKDLYQARLNNIVEHTLCEVMKDFGGQGRRFTNVYPIRYPGTWDADDQRRQHAPYGGPAKWNDAKDAFLATPLVKEFVKDASKKWDASMDDNDGCLSLVCDGFLRCTSSAQKQETLEGQIKEIHQTVRNLAQSWYVDPNANLDRDKRIAVGKRVVEWLSDEEFVYQRAYALEQTLSFSAGNAMELAEFADQRAGRGRTETIEERFPRRLHDFLKEWATVWAPQRWTSHVNESSNGDHGQWLPDEEFGALARYLGDYLRCDDVFPHLNDRLLQIITLQVSDQGARRHVVREYVQLVLNDFVMNPGASSAPLDPEAGVNGHQFGLMTPFVLRWTRRLPLALASAAGTHTEIPHGNEQLSEILTAY